MLDGSQTSLQAEAIDDSVVADEHSLDDAPSKVLLGFVADACERVIDDLLLLACTKLDLAQEVWADLHVDLIEHFEVGLFEGLQPVVRVLDAIVAVDDELAAVLEVGLCVDLAGSLGHVEKVEILTHLGVEAVDETQVVDVLVGGEGEGLNLITDLLWELVHAGLDGTEGE